MAKISHDKDSWSASGVLRRDFRHAYDPADDEESPHKSKSRGKGCKRSKDRVHDFSETRIGMAYMNWSEWVEDPERPHRLIRVEKRGYREKKYTVCAKCGKPQDYMWRWSYRW